MIDKKALITRENPCESHGAGPNRWNDHQLLPISGLGPNLTAAVTWMLNHLLEGDGHLATSIHMEAESFVEKSDEEIDLCRVFDESRFCRPRGTRFSASTALSLWAGTFTTRATQSSRAGTLWSVAHSF
ncbi:hypothetical protein CGMCC3_g17672 [Colletotrichum fructicola]|uniref:Uncharacterized protein n=1 Tax=Colletotrichum fructicola (strain Nara gc5) TaxID=1213859 RepID=A0A7J6INM8_COLFN|nr:uncharacterized protein CGMCC3_g17672 [Colletotrichum fructicola]KAE9566163.1 hypothetical protein CGMCC3_g17672 [Colletotrichum fructicola]KAF4477507.1 hypothetical protein CGGC5_v014261 [Colletotrichum fructicola Nara gc5]KAF4881898.1 hypothetical protein CGCFRS4_v015111 [Colletotrichum fructicola]KAF4933162.1 hypothetical protein CGCF245_v009923 [Colletotrichum fructicola]